MDSPFLLFSLNCLLALHFQFIYQCRQVLFTQNFWPITAIRTKKKNRKTLKDNLLDKNSKYFMQKLKSFVKLPAHIEDFYRDIFIKNLV